MKIDKLLTKTESGYVVSSAIYYYSRTYKRDIKINKGFESDGATFYWDLHSIFWIVHDYLKVERQWKDGTHCSNWQASVVAFEILISEDRYIHAPIVFTGTLLWGYTKQFFKGLK